MATSIKQIRRRELEEAAYELLCTEGFTGATVSKVAGRVGMSRGIVHHYFRGKDELLEAAIRYANRSVLQFATARLDGVTDPMARLAIIIQGYFGDTFTRPAAQFWVSFISQVTQSSHYARIQRVLERRLQSNLAHELRHWMSRARAWAVARQISIVMDGAWVRLAATDEGLTREEAQEIVVTFVAIHLPGFREAFSKHASLAARPGRSAAPGPRVIPGGRP